MLEKKRGSNGKNGSRNAAGPSVKPASSAEAKLRLLLKRTFDRFGDWEDAKTKSRARELFVFHMTDWLEDLKQLSQVCAKPDQFDAKTAEAIVYRFLLHAPSHLQAAKRMLGEDGRDLFAKVDREYLAGPR